MKKNYKTNSPDRELKISLSLEKFKEIFKDDPKDESSELKYLLKEASYIGKIMDNSIFLRMKFKLTSFTDKYQILSLIPSNAVVKDVKVGKDLEFGFINGKYILLINKIGEFNLEFDLHILFNSQKRKNSFIFESPLAGRLHFLIPEKDAVVTIPNISDIKYKYLENSTEIETNIPFGKKEISWNSVLLEPKKENSPQNIDNDEIKEDIAQKESIIYGEVKTSISINETMIKVISIIDYKVYKSAVDYFDLEISGGKVVNIDSDEIKNYTINNDDKNISKITIYPKHLVSSNFNLMITYEKTLEEKENFIPVLKLKSVNREKGKISVSSTPNIELSTLEQSKLLKIDISELPSEFKTDIASGSLLGFQYFSAPYKLKLNILKYEEIPVVVAIADYAIINTVVLKEGKVLNQIDLKIRNNSKTFINFSIPENSTPMNATVNNSIVKPVRGEDKSIMIPIEKANDGEKILDIKFSFTMELDKFKKSGSTTIKFGSLDIPIRNLYWRFYFPEEYNYKKFRGDLKLVDYLNVNMPAVDIPLQGEEYNFEGYFVNNEELILKFDYKKKFKLFNKNSVEME